jgi:hypothetical protein
MYLLFNLSKMKIQQYIGNVFDKHSGAFKLIVATTIIVAMAWGFTALASATLGEELTFAEKEQVRAERLLVEITPSLRTTYCLPRIADIQDKIDLYAKLDEVVEVKTLELQKEAILRDCPKYAIEALSSFTPSTKTQK